MANIRVLEQEIWFAYYRLSGHLSNSLILGEIIYAHVPGRRMIILNSFTVARDILSQNIHSGRPRLIGQE